MPIRLARLAPLALALLLPGCVAAVPAAPYVAGAATTVGATYLGDATFDYAGRRLRVGEMTCDDLQVAYAQTARRQPSACARGGRRPRRA